jgi:anti-sigma factor RsiW
MNASNDPNVSHSGGFPVPHENSFMREQLLADFTEGLLPAADAQAVQAHLLHCGECRSFCAEWNELDERLLKHAARATLSTDFSQKVLLRVEAEPPRLPMAQRKERALQLQEEVGKEWKEARRQFIRLHFTSCLDGIGYVSLFLLAVAIAVANSDYLTALLVKKSGIQPAYAPLAAAAWLGSGAALLVAFGFAGRDRLRRLLA